ncbi:hypothetical protein EJB05_03010 [Eragrostis curvula]|uniref:DUF6598 domain-containing protein n=1 Tax=Eragrostis curvula TaxID=38414 RepID=A0A5J9WXQ7_9POAL|nr:hypothetical protein EJB05_03010 [Eragrostis curvula]
MASSSTSRRGTEKRKRDRRRSHVYDYIILPGGDRFDIPEGEDKQEWIQFFDESSKAAREVIARYGDGRPADGIYRACILPKSTHRDGSIYSVAGGWHKDYRISNTTETQLDPMILSNPPRCYPDQESCILHTPRPMMQIFSLKLATISAHTSGPALLYGYIATRDTRDELRNYVFNRSRDNPIMLELGSLIEMIGPKPCIGMRGAVLIEYDMKIKIGEEQDDLQLIDGVSDFDELMTPVYKPFLNRIDGAGGAVDITLAMFHEAVEATIQVDTSQVNVGSGFSCLLLNCFVSGQEEEIQLFHGGISQLPGRFVVAVVMGTWMHLKLKFGDERGSRSNEFERCTSFKAKMHGCASQEITLDEGSVMVNVTWSTF